MLFFLKIFASDNCRCKKIATFARNLTSLTAKIRVSERKTKEFILYFLPSASIFGEFYSAKLRIIFHNCYFQMSIHHKKCTQMTKLSVNINKIATIRNARGGNNPDIVRVALDCERFGADGITVHPRPDERHIRYADVHALRPLLTTEFNIEGYPQTSFVDLVKDVKPAQVTLVPDGPNQITSNSGWDTRTYRSFLTDIVADFKALGIRTSIFIGTEPELIELAAKTGADRVELYTEPYATAYSKNPAAAAEPFVRAAEVARQCGLGLNAGHDLSLDNLHFLYQQIPWLDEVSIGHALICDALYLGLEETIRRYKACLK